MTWQVTELLDQVCIDPRAGPGTLDRMADECVELGLAAFCVYPWWVERVAKRMGDRVATSGIVSMPIGLEGTAAKVAATKDCVASGATEIDFLAAWSAILYGDLDAAIRDAAAVVEAAKAENPAVITKAIIESPEMEQIPGKLEDACRVVVESGADFGKTSTGLSVYGGGTVAQVRAMRAALPDHVEVKAASPDILTLADAVEMVEAGSTRLGTPVPIQIALEEAGRLDDSRMRAGSSGYVREFGWTKPE